MRATGRPAQSLPVRGSLRNRRTGDRDGIACGKRIFEALFQLLFHGVPVMRLPGIRKRSLGDRRRPFRAGDGKKRFIRLDGRGEYLLCLGNGIQPVEATVGILRTGTETTSPLVPTNSR